MNESKRSEALKRQAAWAALTPQEQLADLDLRLGKGQGARKQRAQIALRMEKAEPTAPVFMSHAEAKRAAVLTRHKEMA